MKNISLKLLLLIVSCIFFPVNSYAERCNPEQPSFTIDGVEQWNNQPITEIFKQLPKEVLPKGKQRDTEGVSLTTWISKHAKKGYLNLNTCSGKSLNIEVSNLLIDDPEKQKYYLVLARKNFFKLITGNNSKPVIKGIKSFKLTTK